MLWTLRLLVLAAVIVAALLFSSERGVARGEDQSAVSTKVDRGRYLVLVGGCNDCHTPMFGERAGQVPEAEWLVGAPMGFSGPWGTSYPTNLRRMVDRMEEEQWVQYVRTYEALPPMPWWALHAMKHDDLQAIYAFVRSLGPAGEEAPAALPPNVAPSTPYISFMPVFPQGGTK